MLAIVSMYLSVASYFVCLFLSFIFNLPLLTCNNLVADSQFDQGLACFGFITKAPFKLHCFLFSFIRSFIQAKKWMNSDL